MYKLGDYPEEDEYVLGTVKTIFQQGAFITLDEYENNEGMLHLREISPRWVRNIRDYVKEGQKVVLKVLRVDPGRGHIDLSLRRVSDIRRKEKLMEVKQRHRAIKLLELLEKNTKIKGAAKTIYDELINQFSDAYIGLEEIAIDNKCAEKLKIDEKLNSDLITIINENIKPPFVEISGFVELKSYEPDGVDKIKKSLELIENFKDKSETGYKISVTYISAPLYRVHVLAENYKSAEKLLRNSVDAGIEYIQNSKGAGEFFREMKK